MLGWVVSSHDTVSVGIMYVPCGLGTFSSDRFSSFYAVLTPVIWWRGYCGTVFDTYGLILFPPESY